LPKSSDRDGQTMFDLRIATTGVSRSDGPRLTGRSSKIIYNGECNKTKENPAKGSLYYQNKATITKRSLYNYKYHFLYRNKASIK